MHSQYENIRNVFIDHLGNIPPEYLKMVYHFNYIYTNHHKIFHETKGKNIDARDFRMSILNTLDEETKEVIRKEKFAEYQRRNKSPLGQFKPWTNDPLPLKTN